MKTIRLIFPLLALLLPLVAGAQTTNLFYAPQDFDLTLGPTFTIPTATSKPEPQVGYSYETDYWQTRGTSTGLELGSYNMRNWQLGIIDHLALIESFRVVPFKSTRYLDRVCLELKTGAETYFIDGSKNVEIAFQVDYALSPSLRVDAGYWQHFRANPEYESGTFRLALTKRF